jgi:uncharacterized protein
VNKFAAAVFSACLALAWVSNAGAQSFDCSRARAPDEQTICNVPKLGALDEKMAAMFFALRGASSDSEKRNLTLEQSTWLKERGACGADANCIQSSYERRIKQLQSETAASAPTQQSQEPATTPSLSSNSAPSSSGAAATISSQPGSDAETTPTAVPPTVSAAQSCDQLWYQRNSIYKANGYCFHTPRGIRAFGNAGCSYNSDGAVPLSAAERRTIAMIQGLERAKGCGP